jgi:hypothetical protein
MAGGQVPFASRPESLVSSPPESSTLPTRSGPSNGGISHANRRTAHTARPEWAVSAGAPQNEYVSAPGSPSKTGLATPVLALFGFPGIGTDRHLRARCKGAGRAPLRPRFGRNHED